MNEQWIPCYQKLPRQNQKCLVTIQCVNGKRLALCCFLTDASGSFFIDDNEDNSYCVCDDVEKTGAIAWIPVPQPYEIPDYPSPKFQNSNNQ